MAIERIDEKEVFNRARVITAREERLAHLQQACGHDSEAMHRVLELLRVYDQDKSFLESPAVAVGSTVAQVPLELPGTVIGAYKLLEEIGEGGFGVVFLAEQTQPVRRKVALKILKPGMDTRQVVARFEAERQALAMMDHPNIAKVFDGGATASGRPYFVMELVKGVPIVDFCDQNHLTPRQRLELFIPVCQAVQHAHHKGIVHRDLKPSNVLVSRHDTTPVVKVIDFGVAKALGQSLTDKTLFTGFATMVGTPLYMSPEQAGMSDLDVDTRSDIYSLGVLLYELLTGTTPFDKERFRKAAQDEIRRIIREEEPPKPSTRLSESKHSMPSIMAARQTEPAKLTKLVRGELDWIVMKALEKDRNRRYETANGFAMDVQRYLNDEQVQACPPSAGYRLRKFVRRNQRTVLAGLALAALFVLGTLGTSIGMAWALQAERAATLAAKAEAEQRRRAEAAYEEEVKQRRQARKAVDEMYTKVAQKWLAQQPRMEKVQREFLEKALGYYQEFAKEQSTDPEVRLETATAYRRLGGIYQKLGQDAEGEEAYGRAIALADALATEYPAERAYREELANNYHQLGYLQMYSNRLKEAESSFGKALKFYEQLVADFGADLKLRRDMAGSRHNLGGIQSGMYGGVPRPKAALESYRQAVELYKGLTTESPDVADYQSSLGGALSDWAMVLLQGGELAEAFPLLKEAVSRQRAALQLEPRQPTYRQFLSSHLAGWADIANAQDRHEEAVKIAREALAVQESLANDFPDVPHYRHATAERAFDLGKLLKGDSAQEAEATFRQAVVLLDKLADSFTKVPERRGLLADCYREIGLLLDAAGHGQDAEANYRTALKWDPKDSPTLRAFGINLVSQHKYADAESLLRESLRSREQKRPDDWMTYEVKAMLGGALLGQKKYADAEPLLLAGYEGMKQRESTIPTPAKARLTETINWLVQLYEAKGQTEQSSEWRKKLAAKVPDMKD